MYNKFELMEKGDLHLHLNGAVPTNIVKDLINRHEIDLPKDYNIETDLQILNPTSNLMEYLKPWKAFKKLPVGYQCLEVMVDSSLSRLKKENVKFVEFRNSPFNISKINNITLAESIKWLVEATNKFAEIHNIKSGLILSLTRHENSYQCGLDLIEAIKKNNSNTIIGIDLSGDECFPISKDISRIYRFAKEDLGLGVSIHAGELGDLDNLKWAIYECNPDRIGHGVAAAKCIKTMDYIRENDICIEVCLTSNLRTGSIMKIEDHPINTFINNKVPFVLCSDNPAVQNSTLTEDYYKFYRLCNKKEIIEEMYNNQIKYSFLWRN